MKKRILALLCAVTMVTGLMTGCGSSSATSDESATTESKASGDLTDFNVVLDWYPNAIHSFMYVAQDKGYFADEGLNVTMTAPAGVSDPLTFPAAGKAEVGLYYMNDATIGYADEDMDIEVIGAVTQSALSCMIALKDKNITSPKDFKGKKVGYSGSESSKQMLITCAEACGLSENDFELIDVGFDIETAITSGTVDVCSGGMLNNEVVELQNNGYDIDYWTLSDYGVPEEYEIIMVANKTAYEKNPDLYNGFLEACKKGFADVEADPDAALDILFNHEDAENYALNRDVESQSLDMLLKVEKDSGNEFLSMTKDMWDTNTKWLLERGLLKNDVDTSEYVKLDK